MDDHDAEDRRRTLIEDREIDGDGWALWSTAARIDVMREAGLSWYDISEAIDLTLFPELDPDGDELQDELAEAHRALATSDPAMLAAARSIVDDEARVEHTEPGVAVDLDWGRAWQLTTERGTRIVIDLRADGPRRMRIPAEHDDGASTRDSSDGKWWRLVALSPEGLLASDGPTGLPPGMARRVVIGRAADLYVGPHQWWTTTRVVAVRQLSADEIPEEELAQSR